MLGHLIGGDDAGFALTSSSGRCAACGSLPSGVTPEFVDVGTVSADDLTPELRSGQWLTTWDAFHLVGPPCIDILRAHGVGDDAIGAQIAGLPGAFRTLMWAALPDVHVVGNIRTVRCVACGTDGTAVVDPSAPLVVDRAFAGLARTAVDLGRGVGRGPRMLADVRLADALSSHVCLDQPVVLDAPGSAI